MPEIPSNEPARLVAGDTWQWTRSLEDYKASDGWTLSYAMIASPGVSFTITAAAAGDDHAVTVAAATTAGYAAGKYLWQAYVTKAAERFKVDEGLLEVEADFATAGASYDPREHARVVLAAIEAVIEDRATKDQESYSINGRSLSRTPLADLLKLRATYRDEVRRLDQAEALAAGLDGGRNVYVRFS